MTMASTKESVERRRDRGRQCVDIDDIILRSFELQNDLLNRIRGLEMRMEKVETETELRYRVSAGGSK